MGLLDYKIGPAPCELFSSQFIKLFYEGAEILFRVLRYSFVLVDNFFCQFGKLRCLDKQEFTFRGSVYYGDQKKPPIRWLLCLLWRALWTSSLFYSLRAIWSHCRHPLQTYGCTFARTASGCRWRKTLYP